MDEDILRSAKSGKSRAGKRELIKHLEGIRLTRQQAIRAQCYDCNGMGDSGDCDIETCPLIPFSLFNRQKRHFSRAGKAKKAIPEANTNGAA